MNGMGGGFGGPGGGFDWNGNGRKDSFDGYIDYKASGSNKGSGGGSSGGSNNGSDGDGCLTAIGLIIVVLGLLYLLKACF